MSDVLLICPNVFDIKIHPIFDKIEPLLLSLAKQRGLVGLARGAIVPPTELLSISSYLLQSGISVSILDLTLEAYRNKDILKTLKNTLKKENPVIVGVRGNEVCFINQYLKISRIVKEHNPGILCVIGGVGATSIDAEILQISNFDIVVRGEGELTFLEICKKHLEGKSVKDIKGISYKKNNRIFRTKSRPLMRLEDLLLPAREIYPLEEMYSLNDHIDLVYTSRGCPYNCSFCNSPSFWNRCWRGRRPEDIVEELQFIEDKGARIAHIHDVNFGVDTKWVKAICHMIKHERLDILWDCQLRVDQLKSSLLNILYKGNCRGAFIGIEAASQNSLNDTNKGYSLDSLMDALLNAKRAGIHIDGGYVVGLPEDNIDSLKATKYLAIKLLESDFVETPIYFLFMPWKGTSIGDNLKKEHISIANKDYRYWHGFSSKPVASTRYVDAKTVYHFWETGWIEIYKILKKKVGS